MCSHSCGYIAARATVAFDTVLMLTDGETMVRVNTGYRYFLPTDASGDAVVYGSGQPEASVPFVPGILKNLQLAFFIVYHLPPAARERAQSQLTAWLAAGRLQHRIAARLPLERIAEAHALVESGRAIGNVVVSTGEAA